MTTIRSFLVFCLVVTSLACQSSNLIASLRSKPTALPSPTAIQIEATQTPAPTETLTSSATVPAVSCPPQLVNRLKSAVIRREDWIPVDGKNGVQLDDGTEVIFFVEPLPDGSLGLSFFTNYLDGTVLYDDAPPAIIHEGFVYEEYLDSNSEGYEYGPIVIITCGGNVFFNDQTPPPTTPTPSDFQA